MTSAEAVSEVTTGRPLRADARRNYEKLLAAGRDAFTEEGSSASLEEIARRAGVGIGTLYRHFPTRQALLEAVYVEEMDALCRSAEDLRDREPWDALVAWLHRFVDYVATKEALAQELFTYVDREADVFHVQGEHDLGLLCIRRGDQLDPGGREAPARRGRSEHEHARRGVAALEVPERRARGRQHLLVGDLEPALAHLRRDRPGIGVTRVGEDDQRTARRADRGDHLRGPRHRDHAVG